MWEKYLLKTYTVYDGLSKHVGIGTFSAVCGQKCLNLLRFCSLGFRFSDAASTVQPKKKRVGRAGDLAAPINLENLIFN